MTFWAVAWTSTGYNLHFNFLLHDDQNLSAYRFIIIKQRDVSRKPTYQLFQRSFSINRRGGKLNGGWKDGFSSQRKCLFIQVKSVLFAAGHELGQQLGMHETTEFREALAQAVLLDYKITRCSPSLDLEVYVISECVICHTLFSPFNVTEKWSEFWIGNPQKKVKLDSHLDMNICSVRGQLCSGEQLLENYGRLMTWWARKITKSHKKSYFPVRFPLFSQDFHRPGSVCSHWNCHRTGARVLYEIDDRSQGVFDTGRYIYSQKQLRKHLISGQKIIRDYIKFKQLFLLSIHSGKLVQSKELGGLEVFDLWSLGL